MSLSTRKIICFLLSFLSFVCVFSVALANQEGGKDIHAALAENFKRQQPDININFAPVASPQKTNSPFPITITASDPSYNGTVYLHSTRGEVSPEYVELANGTWSGNVMLYEIGKNNVLQLRWDSESDYDYNVSNSFNVTNTNDQIPNDAKLEGYILSGDYDLAIPNSTVAIPNATVDLYSEDPTQGGTVISSTITDENGHYTFENLTSGDFYLKANASGYEDTMQEIQLASQRTITGNIILDDPGSSKKRAGTNGTIPVLLVPGIMGSTLGPKFIIPSILQYIHHIHPILHFDFKPWDKYHKEYKLFDPYGKVGWGKLKKLLKKVGGYNRRDCTLFDAPYDWSISIENARDQFLIPWIQHAKNLSGQSKVDIIAHSMGGLLVRSYIQSPLYDNDIRKFAMVGTPNKGSDKVYYLWEGGDPKTADEVEPQTGWMIKGIPHGLGGGYFYTYTLDKAAKVKGDNKASCTFSWLGRPISCSKIDIYKFLHKNAPSAGQLMPMYDYALLDDGLDRPIIEEENMLLKALNNQPCSDHRGCVDANMIIYNFTAPWDIMTANTSKVQTKLFVGKEHLTVKSIYVGQRSAPLYKDGKPLGRVIHNSGDGTVWINSVIFDNYLPLDKALPNMLKPGEHANLIGEFQKELCSFITNNVTRCERSKIKRQSSPQSQLIIGIDGRTQPSITNLNGTQVTNSTYLGSDVDKSLNIGSSALVITDPVDGQYTVSLQNPYHEDYELRITYIDENGDVFSNENIGYYDSNSTLTSFQFAIDQHNHTIVFNDRSFDTPVGLDMENITNEVQLSWVDYRGDFKDDVDHYEIYWKSDTDPYYQFLARTNGTEKVLSTGHNWAMADSKTYTYMVRAILKNDNNSTFFSEPVFYIDDNFTNCDVLNPDGVEEPGFIDFHVNTGVAPGECKQEIFGVNGLINIFEPDAVKLPTSAQVTAVYYSCGGGTPIPIPTPIALEQRHECGNGETMEIGLNGSSWNSTDVGEVRGFLSQAVAPTVPSPVVSEGSSIHSEMMM